MEKSTARKANNKRNKRDPGKKRRATGKGAFFWLLVMVIAGVTLWRQQKDVLNLTEVRPEEVKMERQQAMPLLTYEPGQPNYFGTYEKDFIHASKDGVKRLTLDGSTVWSQAFSMKTPYLVIKAPYVGVGDIGGQEIYLLDGKGRVHSVSTTHPILEFVVTAEGWLGVLQQTPTGHQVSIYDPEGKITVDHVTYLEKDGQPLGIFLSPNGEDLVTSYVDTYSGEILTKLTFFNIGDMGALQIDSITGAYHRSNILIPMGKFFGSQGFVAIGDQEMIGFSVNPNPVEIWGSIFTQKVRRVSVGGNQSMALAFGEFLPGGAGEQKEIVKIYNQRGAVQGEFITKDPVDFLHHTDTMTVIGTGRTFYGINPKGKQLWMYTATKDIKAFLPFTGDKRFLLVSQDQVEWIGID